MIQENAVPSAFLQASSHTPSICLVKEATSVFVSHFSRSVDRESEKLNDRNVHLSVW